MSLARRMAQAAAALVLAGAAAGVVPVRPAAAAAPSCSFSRPGNGETRTSASVTIEGICAMSGGGRVVGDLRLSLNGPNTSLSTTRSAGGSAAGFIWTVDLPYNGSYTTTVTAVGEDSSPDPNGAEQSSASVTFNVEAPPATPSGVAATVNANRTVSVTWRANGEPDLVGYQVQRATGSSSEYTAIGNPKTNAYVDESTTGAGQTYKYRIVAVRQGARAGRGVASSPSPVASATVQDPPPPPTTAPPGGGGGGGGNDPTPNPGTGTGTGGSGSATPTSGGTTGASGPPASGGGRTISRGGGGVDLSNFSRLLDQTNRAPAPVTPELDTGYSETLPFAPPTTTGEAAAGSEEVAQPGLLERPLDLEDNQDAWRFLAGGLMATVVAMVLMVIKGQVDLADRLDPLDPVASDASEA